jgi:hypothetical protein
VNLNCVKNVNGLLVGTVIAVVVKAADHYQGKKKEKIFIKERLNDKTNSTRSK